MSNRLTLAQLLDVSVGEAANLPAEHLAMLLEESEALSDHAKKVEDRLHAIMTRRYAERAAALRDGPHGRVRVEDDGYIVQCDAPKRVQWDDSLVRAAIAKVRDWGDDPEEYVQIKHTVPESRYNAWPSSIREVFEPARTVMVGKLSFTMQKKED